MTSSEEISDYRAIALRVKAGDPVAEAELVTGLRRGLSIIARHRGVDPGDVDDLVSNVLRILIENIRAGMLNDPGRVVGYARGTMVNLVRAHIKLRSSVRSSHSSEPAVVTSLRDTCETPEQLLERKEREQLAQRALKSLNPRDREILRRFYLFEQTAEQICEEMRLSKDQYRLLKSRAKARLGDIVQRKMRPIRALRFERTLARSA